MISAIPSRLTRFTRTAVRLSTVGRPNKGTAPIEEETAFISTATHAKNAGLAMLLLGFCGGVAFYSMRAVGQAASGDDPIAALRQEASVAQEKHDQQEKQTQESQDMLKKFQAGDYDPDKYEEENDSSASRKKPWWKIW